MSAKINKLEKAVDELSLDLKALLEEHELYVLDDDEGERFVTSLPIESLKESLDCTWNYPRSRFSIKDFEHKAGLKKLYVETRAKLAKKESELTTAKINAALKTIKDIK